MLYQVACKAAIKGGRVYDRAIIEWLVSKILLLPDIVVCPHGRPIAYKLTKNELDRQFDRIK
jgi:DNA mismatch repair protein MutL